MPILKAFIHQALNEYVLPYKHAKLEKSPNSKVSRKFLKYQTLIVLIIKELTNKLVRSVTKCYALF